MRLACIFIQDRVGCSLCIFTWDPNVGMFFIHLHEILRLRCVLYAFVHGIRRLGFISYAFTHGILRLGWDA
jgi:hypothetical protein